MNSHHSQRRFRMRGSSVSMATKLSGKFNKVLSNVRSVISALGAANFQFDGRPQGGSPLVALRQPRLANSQVVKADIAGEMAVANPA